MNDFSNETIDTLNLPRYEDVELTPIHPSYLNVIWFNIAFVFGIMAIVAGLLFYFVTDAPDYWMQITIGYIVLLLFTIITRYISFRNKGFAFRTHDVIYRSGAISTTTMIIPYNRVQHVAQHEGIVARWLGLATVEIFTAGGTGGDIKIPGLEKIHASALKKLLIGKIENKQEEEETDLYSAAVEERNREILSETTDEDGAAN
ncbi:PH domain-containing protein [Flavobacterium psychrotrophum]|uniref:PH domain-containing protein n=1 Tax=Flavobacterium psychrotrophum TaxID=2294119 RepID=UPI000E30D5FA|nr:PH domain-containing protein [Flavobacterium psychrotrophum]